MVAGLLLGLRGSELKGEGAELKPRALRKRAGGGLTGYALRMDGIRRTFESSQVELARIFCSQGAAASLLDL